MNVSQKIDRLIEEAHQPQGLVRLTTKDKDLFPKLTEVYKRNFDFRKYVPKDIQKFVETNDTELWIKNPKNIEGIVRFRYLNPKKNSVLSKLTKRPKIIFMSDLISLKKGTGKELIEFVAKKAHSKRLEFFSSAWKKELIPYYEKMGFEYIDIGNPKLHMLKYKEIR